MATSNAMCRLQLRGRDSLAVKCLKSVQTCLYRSIGTNAVASRDEAQQKDAADQKDEPKSFYDVLAERQAQARRSVLINCFPATKEKKFLKYLSKHGQISKYFFYKSSGIHAVVEFADLESVSSLLEEAVFPSVSHEATVPFKSRHLHLKNVGSVDSLNSQNQQMDFQCHPQTTIPINDLIEKLSREDSIEQQINSLTTAYQLTEENSRLRFLVCSLLQDIATAFFPDCSIKPFGSSVNGFGKLGCDLDMFLDLDQITGLKAKMVKPRFGLSMEYQLKSVNSERAVTQKVLTVIGESVDQFGPGCVGVQKILNARCPLVRFSHQPSGFQCDLTANNRVAMKSTELLYLYGSLDPRVRSLVFTVRCWASVHSITSSFAGAWISNFSLTVLVLFFLQSRSPPIIPNLDHLSYLAGPADKCVIEGNDCTFVSDFSKIKLQRNTERIEQLLCEFFDFYATFPFNKMSINIRKGKSENKTEVDPLHIQNPFETSLNVSKNVNAAQLGRFVELCQESSWLLHQGENTTPEGGNITPWGLASLLMPSQVAQIKNHKKKKKQELASERIKGLLESIKNNQQKKK